MRSERLFEGGWIGGTKAAAYFRGLIYNEVKKPQGAPKGSKNAAKNKSDKVTDLNSAEKLSERSKVSARTIERDAEFAAAVDKLRRSVKGGAEAAWRQGKSWTR